MKMFTIFLVLAGLLSSPLLFAQSNLDDAVRQVERETGGKILSASADMYQARKVYRVKVLTPGGKVKTVIVPHRDDGKKGRPGAV